MRDVLRRLESLSPTWWGVAFAAAATGATVMPGRRVLAAALAGGAALALALHVSKPGGCTDCGGATSPVADDDQPGPEEAALRTWKDLFSGAGPQGFDPGNTVSSPCGGC